MEPTVELGEGEQIPGGDGVDVMLLADLDEIGVDDVRSAPGRDIPPAHVHPNHSQCVYVQEGELTIRLEDRELQISRGTWVLVPPDVVHTFEVTGDEPAHFLDVHVPSCGLGNFVRGLASAQSEDELRAVRAAFDQQPAPEYASADPGLVLARRVGEPGLETITDRPGRRITLLVDADELAVTESVYGPGQRGPEPHVHHHHADGFVVVEGELTFALTSGLLRAPAGTFVLVPRDVVHSFRNDSTADTRFFNLHAPSCGFGDYLRGRKPDFDQHALAEGGNDPASVIAVRLSG